MDKWENNRGKTTYLKEFTLLRVTIVGKKLQSQNNHVF